MPCEHHILEFPGFGAARVPHGVLSRPRRRIASVRIRQVVTLLARLALAYHRDTQVHRAVLRFNRQIPLALVVEDGTHRSRLEMVDIRIVTSRTRRAIFQRF